MPRLVLRTLTVLAMTASVVWAWTAYASRAGEAPKRRPPAVGATAAEPVVRLMVFDAAADARLEIWGRPRFDYPGADPRAGVQRFPGPAATYALLPTDGGVRLGDREFPGVTISPDDGLPLVLRWGPSASERRLEVHHPLQLVRIRVPAPTPATAGTAGAKPDPKKTVPRLRVIAHLPMETYLKAVVPAEMGAHWPLEALKAQAVAARTYALWALFDRPDAEAHLSANDMAWDPAKARDAGNAGRAVDETAGIVMTERGRIFPAYFHAECGGSTVDARVALPHETKYYTALAGGVRCERCATLPADRFAVRNDTAYTLPEITRRLRAAGLVGADEDVLRLMAHDNRFNAKGEPAPAPDPLPVDQFRRAAWIAAHTSKGERPMLGARFRMAMGPGKRDVSSTYLRLTPHPLDQRCQIETRGWGHGAGMCQWGAHHRADQPRREGYRAILQWYYPGVRLFAAYAVKAP